MKWVNKYIQIASIKLETQFKGLLPLLLLFEHIMNDGSPFFKPSPKYPIFSNEENFFIFGIEWAIHHSIGV